jgi:hypothetical protein
VRRIACVILVAAAAHAIAIADSGGGAADRAVAEAQTRAANNDFVGAAAKYREAFKADPRPDLMCNVGVAYYKAKDLPRAQRYLDQCLAIGTSLDRAFIDNVKKVLAAVESTLGKGTFTPVDLLVQPPTATTAVEGGAVFDEPIVGSRRVWFPYGTYKLTVHAEGHVDVVIPIDARDHAALSARGVLALAPAPPPPIETGSVQGSADVGSSGSGSGSGSASVVVVAPPPMPPPRVSRPSKLAPIIATSAAAALGGVGVVYYIAALGSADRAGMAVTEQAHDVLEDEAYTRQRIAWMFAAAAGAGAIVSGVLWYRYANAPHVEVQATGSGAAVTLSGRW